MRSDGEVCGATSQLGMGDGGAERAGGGGEGHLPQKRLHGPCDAKIQRAAATASRG